MNAKRILVVDGDVIILEYLSKFLSIAGYKVFTADKGSKAIEILKEDQLDLILMDTSLPDRNGFEVCTIIRKTSNVPIIFVTVQDEVHHRIMGFSCGCDDYIAKPFDSSELLLRVKALLRRAQGTNYGLHQVKKAQRLTINRTTRMVTKNNQEVELTAKEFELLWLLMSHPYQVFTREQLVYNIWNSDFCGDTAAVNMLVKRLRMKIEDNPSKPEHIKTVRGCGYKFEH